MKQEMNAFDVRATVRELQAFLGGRVDKFYQPQGDEVLLRARGGDPPRKLDISVLVGKALHVSTLPRENPEKPTSFVMHLRKALGSAFIDGVRQHGFDRVVEFVFRRKDGTYLLVVELFHDGNVVLVKDDRILAPLMHQSWAHREVRPGADWVPPPSRADPATLTADEFAARMRASNADAVRTLATEMNLGGQYAEEVCAQAGVDKRTPATQLTDEHLAQILAALRALLERVSTGELDPVVVRKGGEKIDVAPFPLLSHAGLELERFPTFQEALDAYFGRAVTVERVDPRVRKVDEQKQKTQRMLDAQRAAAIKFEREDEECRRKGDVLYGHFDVASRIARTLWDASKSAGWAVVQEKLKQGRKDGNTDALAVTSVDPHEGWAMLELDDETGRRVKVRIDLRKTVQENADDYYSRSKKVREKRKGALAALVETEAKMRELTERGVELVAEIEEKRGRAPATKRFWFETFRWFLTSDGHVVMAGRDARTNERLVAKQLEEYDRYLHADVSGAPSVVVKANAGAVSEAALEEAACFAASMSRIWGAGHASGEAYWVTPSQVSKTPNPGEYVAKGAFIIRGKRNFIRVPIRLGVGEVEIEGARKIMGGPVAAIASRSTRYVIIEPGPTPTNELANTLSATFGVPVEEIQTVLPPGGVRVVERHGVTTERA